MSPLVSALAVVVAMGVIAPIAGDPLSADTAAILFVALLVNFKLDELLEKRKETP